MIEYKDEQFNLEEIPAFALQPAKEPEITIQEEVFSPPVQLVSAGEMLHAEEVSFRNLCPGSRTCFWVEEEILIPDSKPDLEKVLFTEGESILSETEFYAGKEGLRFLKLSGELFLQVLYRASEAAGGSLISLKTKLPFREDAEVNASSESELSVFSRVRELEASVINERKLRIRAEICLDIFEYRTEKRVLLQGALDPEMQCRKEPFAVTDVFARKRERLDLREVLSLREGMPEIGEILSYDVRLGAASCQMDSEKAVVNVPVFYSILYRRAEDIFSEVEGDDTAVLQGKTEFTQFISPGEKLDPESCCRVRCRICDISLEPSLETSGRQSLITLSMAVETAADFYDLREEANITDLYHRSKEALFDRENSESVQILGELQGDTAVRAMVPLPGEFAGEKLLYGKARPQMDSFSVDGSTAAAEGVLEVCLVCGSEQGKNFSARKQNLPFRCVMNSPVEGDGADIFGEVFLQDLWLEPMGSGQAEVNATVGIRGTLLKKQSHGILKNVSLAELPEGAASRPSIVVCFAREGDDLWSVSKRYQGDPEQIRSVNGLSGKGTLRKGEKLLVVR